jgi:hypothetical protein
VFSKLLHLQSLLNLRQLFHIDLPHLPLLYQLLIRPILHTRNRRSNLLLPNRISLILFPRTLLPISHQPPSPDFLQVIRYLNAFLISLFKLHLQYLLLLIQDQLSFPVRLNREHTSAGAEATQEDGHHYIPPFDLDPVITAALVIGHSDVIPIIFFSDV